MQMTHANCISESFKVSSSDNSPTCPHTSQSHILAAKIEIAAKIENNNQVRYYAIFQSYESTRGREAVPFSIAGGRCRISAWRVSFSARRAAPPPGRNARRLDALASEPGQPGAAVTTQASLGPGLGPGPGPRCRPAARARRRAAAAAGRRLRLRRAGQSSCRWPRWQLGLYAGPGPRAQPGPTLCRPKYLYRPGARRRATSFGPARGPGRAPAQTGPPAVRAAAAAASRAANAHRSRCWSSFLSLVLEASLRLAAPTVTAPGPAAAAAADSGGPRPADSDRRRPARGPYRC
jgi:hypothetical protein